MCCRHDVKRYQIVVTCCAPIVYSSVYNFHVEVAAGYCNVNIFMPVYIVGEVGF